MKIEINPKSLLNLENICEVLYKLHPYVLDELLKMERNFGGVLGKVNLLNLSLEEREFFSKFTQKDYKGKIIKRNENARGFHNLITG